MSANSTLNFYFSDTKVWHRELWALRNVLLACDLQEEKKWRHPVYCVGGQNVANLSDLKDSVRVGFFQGYLLDDPMERLIWAGPNSRQAKYMEFTSLEDIQVGETKLRHFIAAAKELVGREVDRPAAPSLDLPAELAQVLDADPAMAEAFAALTPGRQRSYLIHISGAKQSATRLSRAQKAKAKIMRGLGFNEYEKP